MNWKQPAVPGRPAKNDYHPDKIGHIAGKSYLCLRQSLFHDVKYKTHDVK